MTRVVRHLLLLAAFVVLAAPAAASATPRQVIRDCADDGALSRKYSNSELRKARDNLPTDLAEYSDCRDLIGDAITSGSDKGGGRGSPGQGVGGAGAADPGEQGARAQDAAELEAITSGAGGSGSGADEAPSVEIGDEPVEPGTKGLQPRERLEPGAHAAPRRPDLPGPPGAGRRLRRAAGARARARTHPRSEQDPACSLPETSLAPSR